MEYTPDEITQLCDRLDRTARNTLNYVFTIMSVADQMRSGNLSPDQGYAITVAAFAELTAADAAG